MNQQCIAANTTTLLTWGAAKQLLYKFRENNVDTDSIPENTAGVYLRTICKELRLAMGDTQYHLYTMEKEGRIKSRRIGQHRHYYPITILDEQHELILAFLRQETPRDILIYLKEHPGSTQRNLANFKKMAKEVIDSNRTASRTKILYIINKCISKFIFTNPCYSSF